MMEMQGTDDRKGLWPLALITAACSCTPKSSKIVMESKDNQLSSIVGTKPGHTNVIYASSTAGADHGESLEVGLDMALRDVLQVMPG